MAGAGAAERAEWAADRTDVAVSLTLLAGLVLLGDVLRRMLGRLLAHSGLEAHAAELVSTLQLCCCTHELRVLTDVGRIQRRLAHTLTYMAAVVHGLTFRGTIGNPACTLVHAYQRRLVPGAALRKIACQFAAAAAARALMPLAWSLNMSDMHARYQVRRFQCTSPIDAPLVATAVELACAFAVQTAITHTRNLEEKYRVHAVAAVITTAVYAVPLFRPLAPGVLPRVLARPGDRDAGLRAALRLARSNEACAFEVKRVQESRDLQDSGQSGAHWGVKDQPNEP